MHHLGKVSKARQNLLYGGDQWLDGWGWGLRIFLMGGWGDKGLMGGTPHPPPYSRKPCDVMPPYGRGCCITSMIIKPKILTCFKEKKTCF